MRLRSISAAIVGATFLTLGQLAHAETIVVEDLPGTTIEIQEAVDEAAPGDVIEVGPGHFAGAEIFHRVTIVGSTGTVINESTTPYGDAFAIIGPDASGTEIRGMTIDGLQAGVFALNVEGVKIRKNVFDGLRYGVFASRTDDVKVVNNAFEHAFQGIMGVYSDNFKVVDNLFVNNYQPIQNRGGSRWIIEENIIDGSIEADIRNGIVLVSPGAPVNDNEIRGNWIRHAGIRPPGVPIVRFTGVLLIGFDTAAELNGNLVEKNYVEISIADVQDFDVSAVVALVSLDSNGLPFVNDEFVGNMILKNDSCGVRTPIYAEPEELLASNLTEKNKVKCYGK